MPSLSELKEKWFINTHAVSLSFPPQSRHVGTEVLNSTDGNKISPLIDGKAYQSEWFNSISRLKENGEVYHSGWRLEDVHTLGHNSPNSAALKTIKSVHKDGSPVYMLICRNAFALLYNGPSLGELWAGGLSGYAFFDQRFPFKGSNHFKFVCFKVKPVEGPWEGHVLLGSVDISKSRWDTPEHLSQNPKRDPILGKMTHDLGVMVEGPAVADLELSFIERWDDDSSSFGMFPPLPPKKKITTPVSKPGRKGSHSVQVLHTYGIAKPGAAYSWSPAGEFTIWASYLNAIKKAEKYIYIEDQYFLPFDWEPCFKKPKGSKARESDLFFHLGEAIKRGVKVFVVIPDNSEDLLRKSPKFQRDFGVQYLKSRAAASSGTFVISTLKNGQDPIYVHSKLMICDDEFVLVGSANFSQRSMTYDGELDIGIVDENNQFAKNLRMDLWAEHLQAPKSTLTNPEIACGLFEAGSFIGHARLQGYTPGPTTNPPPGHKTTITKLIDPYAGPDRTK